MPKKKLPQHVKKYFENRGLDPDNLPQDFNDRLADASPPLRSSFSMILERCLRMTPARIGTDAPS